MNNSFRPHIRQTKPNRHTRQFGFSLVELLVGVLISIIGSLVIFQVFALSEGQKRTTTTGSDAQQSGSFAMYQLERIIRGAGSGFAKGKVQSLWGCQLTAYRGGTRILPAASSFPAPFDTINTNVRLVPVLIHPGAGGSSDILTVMYGRADTLNTPLQIRGTPTATSVTVLNSVGIRQNDLLLAFESGRPCTIVQTTDAPILANAADVVKTLPNPIKLNTGTYNNTSTGLSGYNTSSGSAATLVDLGNALTSGRPGFHMFGVDSKNQLVSYDLLNLDGISPPAVLPLADSMFQLQAIYGVDSNKDNVVDTFEAPTGNFSVANLTNGSSQAADRLASIKAIRLALVARSNLRERDLVTPATLPQLFGDTAIPVTIALTPEDQHYRYYVYDVVIPLRNMLLII